MKFRQLATLALAALLVSSAAGVAAAAIIDSPTRQNYDQDTVPDPRIDTTVTKATHHVGWAATEYEDDSGEISELDASVNESVDNPYTLTASDINASEFGEFPRKSDESDNEASALDATEWSSDLSGSAGSGSVSDVTTAPGVDAVQISTSSQSSSDVAKFTYSNFSVTSDTDKRYIQLIADTSTLDSGATVRIQYHDSDADYVEVNAGSSLSESNSTVLANATGEGDVLQEQVGDVTVRGTGDGSMSEIQQITVVVEDADATIEFSAVNVEKLSEWQLGSERVDTDGDGEADSSQTITEPHGAYSVEAVDSDAFSSALSDAELRSMDVDMQFAASDLEDDMDARANVTAADNYPQWDNRADLYYRLQLPDAYDLSYSNAELVAVVELPEERYKTVRTSEGVSDVDFQNVSSWTDHSSSFSGQGEEIVLDGTIQPGDQIAVNFEEVVTDDERAGMFSEGGAAGQFDRESGGGGILGKLLGAVGAILGGSWLFGRKSGGN